MNNITLFIHTNFLREAVEVANTAISNFVQLGDTAGHASCLQFLAELNLSTCQLEEAFQAGESSVKLFREVGNTSGETQALGVLTCIKDSLDKHPGLQVEMAQKKEVQREIDLLLLNEVASALTQRNADDFKEKYEKLDKCESLSAEEISSAISPAMQADYDGAQQWISSALSGTASKHYYANRDIAYVLTRYSGMHYGPNFRLCTTFGHSWPLDDNHVKYAALQLHQEHKDSDWEMVAGYHPPMYDCGLQAQMASSPTLYSLSQIAENR